MERRGHVKYRWKKVGIEIYTCMYLNKFNPKYKENRESEKAWNL